jgi:hypothetical protein
MSLQTPSQLGVAFLRANTQFGIVGVRSWSISMTGLSAVLQNTELCVKGGG